MEEDLKMSRKEQTRFGVMRSQPDEMIRYS
jgi:hypothetical protein